MPYVFAEAAFTCRLKGDSPLRRAYGGKNKGQAATSPYPNQQEDFVLVDLPLWMVRANEDGDAYDGTSDMNRVRVYAKTQIMAPIYVGYNARTSRIQKEEGIKGGYVVDGGHRVSAARLRGDTHIRALMRQSDFDRLVADFDSHARVY
jgi:hypothetical protein